ncbi:unnamed protein product [Diplocarpon coronariae]
MKGDWRRCLDGVDDRGSDGKGGLGEGKRRGGRVYMQVALRLSAALAVKKGNPREPRSSGLNLTIHQLEMEEPLRRWPWPFLCIYSLLQLAIPMLSPPCSSEYPHPDLTLCPSTSSATDRGGIIILYHVCCVLITSSGRQLISKKLREPAPHALDPATENAS